MKTTAVTQSVINAVGQSPPQVRQASFRRISHRELHVAIELSRAIHEETWVELSLGFVCLHQQEQNYSLAVSLPQPLWKSGWFNGILKPQWNQDRTRFEATVVLPEKFERIPEGADVVCDSPAEAPWPFMTDAEWGKRTEPWG